MSRENHFVAEFYNRLWPWIEHDHNLSFCLDDGGAGASSTPDLCFHFLGQKQPLRVECKVVYSTTEGRKKKKDHFRAYRKQLISWNKVSNYSPHLWIAKREEP